MFSMREVRKETKVVNTTSHKKKENSTRQQLERTVIRSAREIKKNQLFGNLEKGGEQE